LTCEHVFVMVVCVSHRYPPDDFETVYQFRIPDLSFTHKSVYYLYPIARWRNDSTVDRDLQRYFKTLVTKSPFLDEIVDTDILHNVSLSEIFHGEDQALGLGIAYWLDALAISIRSEPRWYDSRLLLRIVQIDDNDEMVDTTEAIPHASSIKHIKEHLAWMNERLQEDDQEIVHDGMTIWQRKEEWFPNLYFCERVKEHMQALPHGDPWLMPIMKRLHELERFCKDWLEGPFDQEQMVSKVTNESEVTMEMFGDERTFQCHDGVQRMFRWHLRFTPRAGRLYFYPLPEERKLIIGYIGSHLHTANFQH